MNDPLKPSRREFLNLGTAAGAALLVSSQAHPDSAPGRQWAVRGKVMHVPEPDQLEVLPDALLVIDGNGLIASLEKGAGTAADSFRKDGRLLELGASQYLLPGLIDTHIHAPQW